MQTFLQLVAQDLHNKVGNDLSRTAVVFPNKRASLFFNEHLAAQSNCPLWSPAYVSISDLFRQLSPLQSGDPIRLVCELYKVFREETKSEESLDDFYFWGELLISDFDDVDKNLVDADKLFSNLQDLKNIMDDYEFLSTEQEEAIQQFFQNFSIEKRTILKEKFISLWDKLGDIYHHYRDNLTSLGIAYEGMMYRNVMEQLKPETLKYDRYVFVGFNVLNKVETRFFELLRDAGKAMFYWDYDIFYTRLPREQQPPYTHEAGEFILRNLQIFPNELPDTHFDVLRQPKTVRYISAPTENAQARYLPEWIRSVMTTDVSKNQDAFTKYPADNSTNVSTENKLNLSKEKENAVVLCNEALLLPVLHSIPQEVQNVNITMGFPLAQTPIYSFINALMELQTEGYLPDTGRYQYSAVLSVLKHPYCRQLSEWAITLEEQLTKDNRFYPLPSELRKDDFLDKVFTPQNSISALCAYLTELLRDVSTLYRQEKEDSDIFNQLYRESLFKSFTTVNRVLNLIESGELNVQVRTLKRLLTRILSTANIPFHGEPAIGMQVMGVLETRNLDFRNLVILSLNEGQLPKAGGDSSFIPYNLRKAFGMTTIEHKNAVYAYYFYRLIQRAENVTLIYNTATDGLNRGEMSRFMLQYLVESPHDNIIREYIEAGQSPQSSREIKIDKTQEIIRKLYNTYDVSRGSKMILSPSALNTYLDCRLKFYYRYVAGLKVPDEVSAEIDSALFGTIFHRSAELAYLYLTAHGKEIEKEDLERLLRNDVKLQDFVDTAFKECFFHVLPTDKTEYNGTQLINAKVISSYLRQLLRNDLQYAPFRLEDMEKRVSQTVEVETPLGKLRLNIGGTIDRMDSKEDTLRIVDYKTGGIPQTPRNIEQLFTPGDSRPNYIFQTFLYALIMCDIQKLKVAPSLLYIHRAASDSYSPVIEMGEPRQPKMPVNNFAFYEDEFRKRLYALLQEIFNPEEAFTQTEETKKCEYCDYRKLCRR